MFHRCTQNYLQYSCGCKKAAEFEQCVERRGTNVKCDQVEKLVAKFVEHYCKDHLVDNNKSSSSLVGTLRTVRSVGLIIGSRRS